MTKTERISILQDFLVEEGYRPVVDDDGDLRFKFEGSTYFVILDDDPTYFRLAFANFWSIDSEVERTAVMKAAIHATRMTKVAKVFPTDNNVWATIELFASPPAAVHPVFARSIAALQAAVHQFQMSMSEYMATT